MTAFTDEQKRYLEGFAEGIKALRATSGVGAARISEPTGPDAACIKAQDAVLARGQKLTSEDKAKREVHPLDIYAEMQQKAASGEFPKGTDIFKWKYHGLFYVAPAQDAFMCRLRIPNGILTSYQMSGLADIADRWGGGYSDITTRANLQIREIPAAHGLDVIEAIAELGLGTRGAGADNIRNITASPLAGIDPFELIDTRPLGKALQHHLYNNRALYNLPRKFNIAFDGGGQPAVLEDTNDIGFQAVTVDGSAGAEPGIWFRLALGGITGHNDFARPTGVYVRPQEVITVADAIVRVYIQHGDRTDRRKARLKYLLDIWGFDAFIEHTERQIGRTLTRIPDTAVKPRGPHVPNIHLDAHPQKQVGLNHLGIVCPVGRLTAAQMRGLALLASSLGSGTLRLTVWQNLILSDIADGDLSAAQAQVEALGLDWRSSAIRGGLVACTGSKGCRFAAADTKGHALMIAEYLEKYTALDQPINIHLTGCHHSCAQHYIGDVGLIACKIEKGDESVEGYHIHIGGGYGANAKIGRQIYPNTIAPDVPETIARIVEVYIANRTSAAEPFSAFASRFSVHDLRALADEAYAEAAQ